MNESSSAVISFSDFALVWYGGSWNFEDFQRSNSLYISNVSFVVNNNDLRL